MRDQGGWSIGIGKWGGVRVRLHMFFFLFAAFTLYLGWLETRASRPNIDSRSTEIATEQDDSTGAMPPVRPPDEAPSTSRSDALQSTSMMWVAWLSLSILLASVIVHELGHLYAARRTGAVVDQIVMWPLGGLAPVRTPPDPHAELLTYIAGPAANLLVCAIVAPFVAIRGDGDVLGLLHPLAPLGVAEGPLLGVVLKLTLWINWLLVIVNLIPAFPFDGGRALRAGLLVYWPDMERRTAALLVARSAVVVVAALLVASWLIAPAAPPRQLTPAWFPLILLAIFLLFSAKHDVDRPRDEPEDEGAFGYDFSAGYTSLERTETETRPPQPGLMARWLDRRREARNRRTAEIAAQEEMRMDEILERLHKSGMNSLSEEDKSVLQRVSARYRGRPEQ